MPNNPCCSVIKRLFLLFFFVPQTPDTIDDMKFMDDGSSGQGESCSTTHTHTLSLRTHE